MFFKYYLQNILFPLSTYAVIVLALLIKILKTKKWKE